MELHVVFGAGQVGAPLATILMSAGKRVRIVKRSPAGVPPGAEVVAGDAADPAFCARAAEGAAAIYHCMNPPYDAKAWARLLPLYMENLIAAARRASARLIVLDNVYMLGRPDGRALDETTPMRPSSRKGEVRARVAERLFRANEAGEVVAVSGRASDFYGPGGSLTYFGDHFWPAALAGKRVTLPVKLDTPHTYHYVTDVAAGLATLGCAEPEAYGRPWMLPCATAESTRAWIARMSGELGRQIRAASVPRPVLKAMALIVPFLREVEEMAYQWDEPFVIDDRRFRARFRVEPTASEVGARETVRWALRHYGR
jgi:nucleoside-diphosphate-sugar epimerase